MDKEAMMHLGALKNGYPAPANVIKDVDPFDLDPRNLPGGDLWWYFSSENHRGDITRFGHWKYTGEETRIVINPSAGWRTTLRFYLGQAPGGDRTSYVMHKYRMDPQEINHFQDSCSLCRIFWDNTVSGIGERSGVEDEHGDYLDILLSRIVENSEGNSHNAQDPSTSYQIRGSDDLSSQIDGVPSHGMQYGQDLQEAISTGDFMEVDDLESEEQFDDFDLQDILGQMIDDANKSEASKKQPTASKFSIFAAPKSESVVFKSPVSGSLHKTDKEVSIPAAKLESLWLRLMKIGSKRPTETNQGSTKASQGGISLGRIAKLWKKRRSSTPVKANY